MSRTTLRRLAAVSVVAAVAATTVSASMANIAPGTPKKDVHIGLDNDNADNPFIQPPGVVAKQHMDNTDVLFGRAKEDLLVGKLGGDTEIGGSGADILVGGPEGGVAPNSDVLLGGPGNDINIWAPGDGSDAYVGEDGRDTMVFAPFVTKSNGDLKLQWHQGRKIPRVDIGDKPQFRCEIVKVPKREELGAQFLVRFFANDTLAVTVRQKDVEKLLCPAGQANRARVADLTRKHPAFYTVRLNRLGGTLGAIVAAP
ncbi:calcium-binding protein [Solicola gregarius]|uniref:Calcium-binding protein n=1 Tax=Solicola gregarius TaxID=2908642 RepID=A0AA46YKQ2_9ACTN|nr:hypothetical protein [Solicola gregarius]UYM04829.1 hypothetical protein L0C25_20210 [Solicola gregarius]